MSGDASVGSVVTRVHATDADSALNARLVYALQVNHSDNHVFDVDPLSGSVTLAVPGHALNPAARYLLSLTVSDCGQPPLTTSVQLSVRVMTSSVMTSQHGVGVGVSLVMVVAVVVAVVVVLLVVVMVAIVRCRRQADSQQTVTGISKTTTPGIGLCDLMRRIEFRTFRN